MELQPRKEQYSAKNCRKAAANSACDANELWQNIGFQGVAAQKAAAQQRTILISAASSVCNAHSCS
jgi:hypothetical protein